MPLGCTTAGKCLVSSVMVIQFCRVFTLACHSVFEQIVFVIRERCCQCFGSLFNA